MLSQQLMMRGLMDMTADTVQNAFKRANKIVFVCEAQRRLYGNPANSVVIYIGISEPKVLIDDSGMPLARNSIKPLLIHASSNWLPDDFIFINIGIVCSRKNQIWSVKLFKEFRKLYPNNNMRLVIVGARYTRPYEIEYISMLKKEIDNDPFIELYDVTADVDQYYKIADCLLFTSTNEVTPLVIVEALSYGVPVLSTNIAGIPEIVTHEKDGLLFQVGDDVTALKSMNRLYLSKSMRNKFAQEGMKTYKEKFTLSNMIHNYNRLLFDVSPPHILIDLDGIKLPVQVNLYSRTIFIGTLIDWDEGFRTNWSNRSEIYRSLSYHMEDCVPLLFQNQARHLITSKGFFFELPAMKGALQAIKDMNDEGFRISIVTSLVTHIPNADHCGPEKIEWVRYYLGDSFVKKLVFLSDKTLINGDILIDDKPTLQSEGLKGFGSSWRQIVFDAPYNRQMENTLYPRLYRWKDWRELVYPLTKLAKPTEINIATLSLNISENITVKCNDEICEAQFKQDFLIGVDDNYELASPEIAASSVKGNDSFLSDNQDTPVYIISTDTKQKIQHSLKWKQDEQEKILDSYASEL